MNLATLLKLFSTVIGFSELLIFVVAASAAENMVVNGGFEGARAGGVPPHWEVQTIGNPATNVADHVVRRSGESSMRIESADVTRSYILSDPIPVAPGEVIRGSAFVKTREVPPKEGAVMMTAEFVGSRADDRHVAKLDVAIVAKSSNGWQKLDGIAKVPQNCKAVRLRLGLSFAKGTCWWDDATVTSNARLAARIDLPDARLSPALRALPVLILNRAGMREKVRIRVLLNKSQNRYGRGGQSPFVPRTPQKGTVPGSYGVILDGSREQRVSVPIMLPAPGKVAGKIELFADDVGKQVFASDIKLNVPPPIDFPPILPTHWAAEDGPAKIECRIDLAVSDSQRQGATLEAKVRDAAGKVVASWSNGGKPIPDGITEFTIDSIPPRIGDYTVSVELRPRDGKALAAEQAWHIIPRRLARVTINANGFPEYDGKAIFPLGVFNGGKFEEQAQAGFTVTHAYNSIRISSLERPEDAIAKYFLDETQKYGMKMLFQVPMRQVIDGDWEAVRRRVRMFRNHPGLLAWDEEEGFARGDFKPDTLATLRKIIQEEDPNHPFMVGDSRRLISTMGDRSNFFPADEMDMGMWWWYPFPLRARPADPLKGEEGSDGRELKLPKFFTRAQTAKPLWMGVQSYKEPKRRYPTPEEYRGQAYLAVAAGAKGLMWYGGWVHGGIYIAPREGHLKALDQVVHELHELSPELLGETLAPPQVSPASAAITAAIKRSRNRTILIAVNRTTFPIDATLRSPEIKDGSMKVLYEYRELAAKAGRITDRFAPLAAHVYELRD